MNNVDRAKQMHEEIKQSAEMRDYETAHQQEKALMRFALQRAVCNDPDYWEICMIAMMTDTIDFPRYFG